METFFGISLCYSIFEFIDSFPKPIRKKKKMTLDIEKIVNDINVFDRDDVKCGKNNDYFVTIEANSVNSVLIKLLDRSQTSAAIPKTLFHPNIVLVMSKKWCRNTPITKKLEESVIKTLEISQTNTGPFGKVGKTTVNLYGPVQQRFSVEPNDRHLNEHGKIKVIIERLLCKSRDSVEVSFPDFQITIRTILSAKWCQRCLEALLTPIFNNKATIIQFIELIIKGYQDVVKWLDEQGNRYLVNSYRLNPERLIVQKSRDFTEFDELGDPPSVIDIPSTSRNQMIRESSSSIKKCSDSVNPKRTNDKVIEKKNSASVNNGPADKDFNELIEEFLANVAQRKQYLLEIDDEEKMDDAMRELESIDRILTSEYGQSIRASTDAIQCESGDEEEAELSSGSEVPEDDEQLSECSIGIEEKPNNEYISVPNGTRESLEDNQDITENRRRKRSSSCSSSSSDIVEIFFKQARPEEIRDISKTNDDTIDDSFGFIEIPSDSQESPNETENVVDDNDLEIMPNIQKFLDL